MSLRPVPVERTIWTVPRSSYWWENICTNFTETQWMTNFRMKKSTFDYLVEKLKPMLKKKTTHLRKTVAVEKKIAAVLWKLATEGGYRHVGHLFGISDSTLCLSMREVCEAIVEKLLPRYIQFPSGYRLQEVVDGFDSKWGFPQVIGAIDGSHIPIKRPADFHTDYYNRKCFYSMILQAVVDYRYLFTDIYVGWPGRVHDARVLANSPLYAKASNGSPFPNSKKNINGIDVPVMLLGDPAYPLKEWLMKGFSDCGRLTNPQKKYNYRLSRARVVVENAFRR